MREGRKGSRHGGYVFVSSSNLGLSPLQCITVDRSDMGGRGIRRGRSPPSRCRLSGQSPPPGTGTGRLGPNQLASPRGEPLLPARTAPVRLWLGILPREVRGGDQQDSPLGRMTLGYNPCTRTFGGLASIAGVVVEAL